MRWRYDESGWNRSVHFATANDRSFDSYRLAFNDPLTLPSGACRRAADAAYAQAYDRFVKRVQSTADLLVTFIEAGEAWDLISASSAKLVRGIRAWRNRDFGDFLGAFGFHQVASSVVRGSLSGKYHYSRRFKKHLTTVLEKRWLKDATDGWLEFSLGWGPLISDIGNAVEVLQSPYPELWSKGTSKRFVDAAARWSTGSASMQSWGTVHINYRCEARVRVISDNVRLANQLGFVNLPAAAWAALPGSFLFDWLIPVGKFLSSWTDLLGFGVDRSFRSSLVRISLEDEARYPSGNVNRRKVEDSYGFFRVLNIQTPSLMSRSCFYGRDPSSWWRGLTAFSLLYSVVIDKRP